MNETHIRRGRWRYVGTRFRRFKQRRPLVRALHYRPDPAGDGNGRFGRYRYMARFCLSIGTRRGSGGEAFLAWCSLPTGRWCRRKAMEYPSGALR